MGARNYFGIADAADRKAHNAALDAYAMAMASVPASTLDVFDAVIEKIKGKRDDWGLADAIADAVDPYGSHTGFDGLIQAQRNAGLKPMSKSTLRQYRDVAIFWTDTSRFVAVPALDSQGKPRMDTNGDPIILGDVSFSAHRAAVPAGNLDDAVRVLGEVLKQAKGDPHKVTVAKVRAQVEADKVARGIIAGTIDPTAGTTPAAVPTAPTAAPSLPVDVAMTQAINAFVTAGAKGYTDQELVALAKTVDKAVQAVAKEQAARAKKANRPGTKTVGKPASKPATPATTKPASGTGQTTKKPARQRQVRGS